MERRVSSRLRLVFRVPGCAVVERACLLHFGLPFLLIFLLVFVSVPVYSCSLFVVLILFLFSLLHFILNLFLTIPHCVLLIFLSLNASSSKFHTNPYYPNSIIHFSLFLFTYTISFNFFLHQYIFNHLSALFSICLSISYYPLGTDPYHTSSSFHTPNPLTFLLISYS